MRFLTFAGVLWTGLAQAQGLASRKIMTVELSKTIAEAALSECRAKGAHTAVAVVDQAGQLMVVLRDEWATINQVEMARRKALTAVAFKMSTLEFMKNTQSPDNAARRDVTDMLALGGGIPIQVGSEIVGGVASSGAGMEQDDACARAGLAKVASQLK